MCQDHCRARWIWTEKRRRSINSILFILFYLIVCACVYVPACVCVCGIYTYLCSCVHMWQRVLMYVYILTRMWRADADIKCLPRLLYILSLETGSLIQLRARQFGVAGMQVNSRECTCLHSSNPMLSYQTCAKMHSDYIGDVDLNLGNMPEQHILYLLGHHPAP